MTEVEKIEYAKMFLDKLANGINPIDGSIIPQGDVVNNVRISRCLFFVSDILNQVIDNGGIAAVKPAVTEKKPKKLPYTITEEQLAQFEYSYKPISTTQIISRIIAIGPKENVKRFPKRKLVKWLITLGLIEEEWIDYIRVRRPTERGEEMGISLGERQGPYGDYSTILYNLEAQHFIVDNIEAIMNFDNKEYREAVNLDNQGKRWEAEEDQKLCELFKSGLSLIEIATELKRGEKAIRTRLRRHGFDPDVPATANAQE